MRKNLTFLLLLLFSLPAAYAKSNANLGVFIQDTIHRNLTDTTAASSFAKGDTLRFVPESENKSKSSFRIAGSFGYAWRLAERAPGLDPGWQSVENDLLNGLAWNVEIQTFVNKTQGVALTISAVHTESGTYQVERDFGFANVNVKQQFLYCGPAWAMKFDTKYFLITSSVSLGVILYEEKVNNLSYVESYPEEYKRSSFGSNIGVGFEYKFAKYCAAGIRLATTMGEVSLKHQK